eukprot:scaffold90499_cov53-Attheya_sp.AAC.2
MATPHPQNLRPALILPHQHPLSLKFSASQAANDETLRNIHGVESHSILSPGLVQIILRAGAASTDGYGSRSWPLLIGGAGIGDSQEIANMFGGDARGPIAVRFAVPISMNGVDDAFFCDGSFWKKSESNDGNENSSEDEEPTLLTIVQTAVKWLEGTGENNKDGDSEWMDAARHSSEKLRVIRQYASCRINKSLVLGVTGRINPEWIVPALRPIFVYSPYDDPSTGVTSIPPTIDYRTLVTTVAPGIFTFDLFTPLFCSLLINEVDAFEATKLPCRRPNTMNKLGLVVNDIGMEPIMTQLLKRLIAPICKVLYPEEMITSALDHHHSFVVQYRAKDIDEKVSNASSSNATDNIDNNAGLDMHHDASEATLNVCLGRDEFTSGGLRFCGKYGDRNHRSAQQLLQTHTRGRAILHLGRHRHGADDISAGERMNLIVWARNSAYRGAAAFGHVALDGSPKLKEDGVLDMLCLSKANDRDYEEQMKRIDMLQQTNVHAGIGSVK